MNLVEVVVVVVVVAEVVVLVLLVLLVLLMRASRTRMVTAAGVSDVFGGTSGDVAMGWRKPGHPLFNPLWDTARDGMAEKDAASDAKVCSLSALDARGARGALARSGAVLPACVPVALCACLCAALCATTSPAGCLVACPAVMLFSLHTIPRCL